jgi:pimeloyl-ACP methyl ester carboxylesterase
MPNEGMSPGSTGHYVKANGLNMYYEEFGAGRPLILLHGGTSSSSTWQPYLHLFTPHFKVITPDSRAHGRTNNSLGKLSYALMARDVVAFIHELHLEQPLVYGYSDGGQIALELGIRFPDLCQALVIGAAWYKFSPTYLNSLKSAGFEGPGQVNFERIQRDSPDWVVEMRREHPNPEDPDYWKALFTQISEMWYTPLEYSEQDFQKITVPTLVYVGDRDGIIELEQAVDMYGMIPNAELLVVPGATHFTAENDLTHRIVLDFLIRYSSS